MAIWAMAGLLAVAPSCTGIETEREAGPEVTLGDDIYTHGGAASGCLTGVRRSSDSGATFGPLLCAVKNSPPDPDLHGCRLRDGRVVMGDEVTHELVLVFWCSSRLPPVAPRTPFCWPGPPAPQPALASSTGGHGGNRAERLESGLI